MSGSGFTVLSGDGARLERALINWFLDVHLEQGYTEFNVPYLVNREAMTGTGQLPKLESDMYYCQVDDLFLIPTAEVSVTNLHMQETLDGVAAAPEVLRLLALLPPRGRRRGQGHPRPAARPPVPQGGDGEVRRPGDLAGTSWRP